MTEPLSISFALQGGGAHGAFTWGVLDRFLEEDDIRIDGISAISTGAMTASVLVSALTQGGMRGGRQQARVALESFWRKVSTAMSMTPFQPTIFDKFLGNTRLEFSPSFAALDFITQVFSPYQFNLFDINPFKDILKELVDFDIIRQKSATRLFLGATNVFTGNSHIFNDKHVSLEAILASACLPYVFKTVELDETPYWDGGFSACPPLKPLIKDCKTSDVLVVRTSLPTDMDIPTKGPDILDRATEISFNNALTQEMRQIDTINRILAKHPQVSNEGYRPIHLHMIEAGELLQGMGRSTKLNADWEFLRHLRDIGRQAAADWLRANKGSLGKKGTFVQAA